MPIRSVAWDELSVRHVQEHIDRKIRESRTLDYKGTLKLDDSGKLDLLEDVTAMANASGGTILYGAVEGTGEDKGLIVRYESMALDPDNTDQQIANLLRDNVEERIHHVLFRAIPVDGGGYLYVIRIPPSPLAPHMVTLRSRRDRFHLRTNISNEPMRMQQIRDAVLRSDTAAERARARIEERTDANRAYVAKRPVRSTTIEQEHSIALLHIIPLFQSPEGVDLSDQRIADRLKTVFGYGAAYPGNLRWALEGLYSQYEKDGLSRDQWVMLDRGGALEFGETGVLYPSQWSGESKVLTLDVLHFDADVLRCVEQARELSAAGWFTPPLLLSLRLLHIEGAILSSNRSHSFGNHRRFPSSDLIVPPEIVTDWGDGMSAAVRRIFHTVWQAFGYQRCGLYNEDGTRNGAESR